jgi:hypothetical protein
LVTVRAKVAVPFPGEPILLAVCVNARSAELCTVPQVCEELLLGKGSRVAEEILAPLQSWLPFATDGLKWTTSVKVAAAPATTVAVVHDIGPFIPTGGVVQLQPEGTASDTKVVPAGRVSDTDTVCASLGPRFVPVRV